MTLCNDCRRGVPCAKCLAEDLGRNGRTHVSTVICLPHSLALLPDTEGQALACGAARAAVER